MEFLLPLLVFLAVYAVLVWRAKRRGRVEPSNWKWLALLVACAAFAALIGTVTGH